MNYSRFKKRIAGFSSNRGDVENIQLLLEKTNISLVQVARDSVPLKLIHKSGTNRKILRRMSAGLSICFPREVRDDSMDIEIDDDLIDAVALHVLAGIETARAPAYMKMYYGIIENHEYSLINDDLTVDNKYTEDLHD